MDEKLLQCIYVRTLITIVMHVRTYNYIEWFPGSSKYVL